MERTRRAIRPRGWKSLAILVCGCSGLPQDEPRRTESNVPIEISLAAPSEDVEFTDPRGEARRVPTFHAAGVWKVRYASPLAGVHRYRGEGVEGRIEITSYTGTNPLYRRGPIRVSADRRRFEHADGTPFFWLGDTWWMGLCKRLAWPDDFQKLAADRREKGFNVIQIVAGLYPDMPPFDERGANEAGFPWEKGYARLRPEYFDLADRRIAHLIDEGLTPCIVGAWGYFLPWMGVERAKEHWRHLIARYGAWPVVWCIAGEANLPYYLTKGFPYDDREQVKGWTEVARYVRRTDPFRRPISIHPTGLGRLSSRGAIDDETLLDFDMLQTGHGLREVLAPTVTTLRDSFAASPRMPVLNSEVSYEALLDRIPAEIARLMFWTCVLSGAAGHTYGANGIWQVNVKGRPHGSSPHGGNYGNLPWDEAMELPGSRQIGLAKKLLEELPWYRLEPRPEGAAWQGGPQSWGDWIWFPEGEPQRDAPAEARFFRRTFDLPAAVLRADLQISADDGYTVWLNGHEAGSGSSWQSPGRHAVGRMLKPGRNVLAVRAENARAAVAKNPAGLTASLAVALETGSPITILTDGSWRADKVESAGWRGDSFDDSSWQKAAVVARHGEGPWGKLDGDDASWVPYSAAAGNSHLVIYVPERRPITVRCLMPDARYRVTRFDPADGGRTRLKDAETGPEGTWTCPPPETGGDWVLILEKEER